MLSQCWLSCHSIFPSQGCSQLAVSTQRRQEAPGDQDCIKTDMASSCWWSVPLACNTSWNIPDTWTQKKKKGTVFYCTTFAKGIISVSEGWGQVFFFFPLKSLSPSWTLGWAPVGSRELSQISLHFLQLCSESPSLWKWKTTHHRKLPSSSNNKSICCPWLLCNAVITCRGSNHLLKSWTKLHH